MQRNALCRSRRKLSNAYLLAEFGFDTAENEPSKGCHIRADAGRRRGRPRRPGPGPQSGGGVQAVELEGERGGPLEQTFGGLILGCVDADCCKSTLMLQFFCQHACCRIFRRLQDLRTSAPIQLFSSFLPFLNIAC